MLNIDDPPRTHSEAAPHTSVITRRTYSLAALLLLMTGALTLIALPRQEITMSAAGRTFPVIPLNSNPLNIDAISAAIKQAAPEKVTGVYYYSTGSDTYVAINTPHGLYNTDQIRSTK
jgi:hypothetical protein